MTPSHPAAPPANPLAAKAGRLFVVRNPPDGQRFLVRPWRNGVVARTPHHGKSARFTTAGEAASFATTWPFELAESEFVVEPYDPPSDDQAKDAERVKWVAGEGAQRNGAA